MKSAVRVAGALIPACCRMDANETCRLRDIDCWCQKTTDEMIFGSSLLLVFPHSAGKWGTQIPANGSAVGFPSGLGQYGFFSIFVHGSRNGHFLAKTVGAAGFTGTLQQLLASAGRAAPHD